MSILDKITGKKITSQTTDDKVVSGEKKTEEVKKEAVKSEKKVKKTKTETNNPVYGILISPIVTEKTAKDEAQAKYTFLVNDSATKLQIKKAFLTRYGLEPIKINVVNNLGKIKRFGGRYGKRKDFRKAIVTLAKGQSVNVYDSK